MCNIIWIAGFFKCCDGEAGAFPFAGLAESARIVCTVTGHGLKDTDPLIERVGALRPIAPVLEEVRHFAGL